MHQAHNLAYLYFTDENRVVDYGFARTTGKESRMIMVHAITKHGLLVSRDSNGVSIQEGWFKPKSKGKGQEGSSDFKMKNEDTAEFL